MTIPFRSALKALAPYPPGKPAAELQRELGLPRIVKLASNENPWGPSPKALAALQAALPELNLYPESGCHVLRYTLSTRLGVPADHLLFGNGSDEIVGLLAAAFLEPGDNIVVSRPSFIKYEMGGQMMGAEIRRVPMVDWKHDCAGLAAAADGRTKFIFVANPDNPVGSAVAAGEIDTLLAGAPKTSLVVLDEAYYEFAAAWADYPDGMALAKAHDNVVVMRTFSKAYGLAGLRVGYAVARPWVWDAVDRIRPTFNVNSLAQVAAAAALDDADHLTRTVDGTESGRAALDAALRGRGFEPVPSLANFLLVDFRRPAMALYEALLREGVIVRPMGMYGLSSHLRISVGLPEENDFFLAALDKVLGA